MLNTADAADPFDEQKFLKLAKYEMLCLYLRDIFVEAVYFQPSKGELTSGGEIFSQISHFLHLG